MTFCEMTFQLRYLSGHNTLSQWEKKIINTINFPNLEIQSTIITFTNENPHEYARIYV